MAAARKLALLALLVLEALGLKVAVLSKIIIDRVDGVWRLGGGGVQAAVGLRLASAACALFAPVGSDFDRSMLGALEGEIEPAFTLTKHA